MLDKDDIRCILGRSEDIMEYYFDEFPTHEIESWLESAKKALPDAEMRGDNEDVKVWKNIIVSSEKEIKRRREENE